MKLVRATKKAPAALAGASAIQKRKQGNGLKLHKDDVKARLTPGLLSKFLLTVVAVIVIIKLPNR